MCVLEARREIGSALLSFLPPWNAKEEEQSYSVVLCYVFVVVAAAQ